MLEKGYSQMLDKEREQWEVCFWKIKKIRWLDKDYNKKFAWERLQWEELAIPIPIPENIIKNDNCFTS